MWIYYYLKATVKGDTIKIKFYNDINFHYEENHELYVNIKQTLKNNKYYEMPPFFWKIFIGKFCFHDYDEGLNDIIKFIEYFSDKDFKKDIDEFDDKVMKRLKELDYEREF